MSKQIRNYLKKSIVVKSVEKTACLIAIQEGFKTNKT
jgi:hypothetical protein